MSESLKGGGAVLRGALPLKDNRINKTPAVMRQRTFRIEKLNNEVASLRPHRLRNYASANFAQ